MQEAYEFHFKMGIQITFQKALREQFNREQNLETSPTHFPEKCNRSYIGTFFEKEDKIKMKNCVGEFLFYFWYLFAIGFGSMEPLLRKGIKM